MPPMTHRDIARALEEARPWLENARIQGARVRGHWVRLDVYGARGQAWLEISVDPRWSRLVLLPERPAPPVEPDADPTGADLDVQTKLRTRLRDALVRDIEQPPGDRVVRLAVEGRTAEEEPLPSTLVAELFGPRASLCLLDADDLITACLRPKGSRHRTVDEGRVWEAPPPPPVGAGDEVDLRRPTVDPDPAGLAWSVAVGRAMREGQAAEHLEGRRRRALEAIDRRRERVERAVAAQEGALGRSEEAERWRQRGELLKASFGQIPEGASEVRLVDWYDEEQPEVAIPLDPDREPGENVQACFRRARKMERAEEVARERLPDLRTELDELEAARETVEEAVDLEEIRAAADGVLPRGWPPPEPAESEESSLPTGVRRFVSADGHEIFVGRSAEANREVTHRLGRGRDLFLHVAGRPGAHVIVRLERGQDPPPQTLVDAAHLALFFSRGGKNRPKGEVSYTRKKWVKSPKGGPPGLVHLARRKTILVDVEPERLDRLLGGD